AADVFAAPGEQSRVVTRVRAGKEMVVLQTKNRWLKVRVNGRTGWITRSNVTTVELAEPAPRAKRRRPFVEGRSTRRGSRGKGPSDRIGGDATDEEIDDDADDEDDERLARERKKARIKRKKAQAKEMDEEILDEDEDEALASGERRDDDDDDDARGDDDDEEDEDEEEKEPEREYVVVKVDSATIYEEASTRSEEIESASEGSKLFVVERDGKWIKVEDENGNEGWVKASKVEDGESGPGYQWEKFAKRARANLGYAALTQNFTSNGAVDPSYKLSSAAAVLSLGGDVLYDYSSDYLIGGDLGYRLHVASPGIRYSDGETAVNIGYKVHQLDLGVRGGKKLSKKSGMAAYGRLGYHYERFGINNVSDFEKNLAYLPSEILQGPTIGAMFEMPKLTEKFAIRASLDYLKFLASRKQTVNLEDGSTSSPSALWFSLGTVYDWKPAWKITGDYQFTYAKTSWSGQVEGSMRPQMATEASRKDSMHLLMIGLGRVF
ncbi:MAG TPA: SH3 domain-containing protein, partial [Kofleriaceae bacterium]|nr:SH3 domain-containing protein [Kofleriaceae bacterium]